MHTRPPLTALFVDFDNVISRLREQDAEAAERFACQPDQWFAWLIKRLEADEPSRRIAVRRCYLTPSVHGRYRAAFLACGFEVVDCPSLTGAGKNGADLRIAVDMLELLEFKVSYDEFILLSADSDFTPVLLHLRKHGCRTAVLAVGNSSAIYRACCDRVLETETFLRDGLGCTGTKEPAPRPTLPAPKSTPAPPAASVASSGASAPLEPATIARLSRLVIQHVRAAPAPVHMPTIAKLIRDAEPSLDKEWAGHKTLKTFLSHLHLARLAVSVDSGGHLYDPAIHEPPKKTSPQE